jgi:small subunit ribosomal protein S6e
MANFKFVVSDPGTRKSHQIEVDQGRAIGVVGKKIGDEFNGDLIGLTGYTLQVTGGTDKDGFPMHPQVHGQGKKRVLLTGAPGFHPYKKGMRKRKTVRGDTISAEITQVNVKVLKKGSVSLDEVAPTKSKVKKEEKKELKVEEKKVEEKKVEEKKAPEGGGGEGKKE